VTRSLVSRYIGQVAPRAGVDGFCVGEDTAKNNAELQTKWTKNLKTSDEAIRRGPNRTIKA